MQIWALFELLFCTQILLNLMPKWSSIQLQIPSYTPFLLHANTYSSLLKWVHFFVWRLSFGLSWLWFRVLLCVFPLPLAKLGGGGCRTQVCRGLFFFGSILYGNFLPLPRLLLLCFGSTLPNFHSVFPGASLLFFISSHFTVNFQDETGISSMATPHARFSCYSQPSKCSLFSLFCNRDSCILSLGEEN